MVDTNGFIGWHTALRLPIYWPCHLGFLRGLSIRISSKPRIIPKNHFIFSSDRTKSSSLSCDSRIMSPAEGNRPRTRQELSEAAAEIIAILKGLPQCLDAKIAVIGGLALWTYLPSGRTTQVRYAWHLAWNLTFAGCSLTL